MNNDTIHVNMSTEYLTREEVQEELYELIRSFHGSVRRRLKVSFTLIPLRDGWIGILPFKTA